MNKKLNNEDVPTSMKMPINNSLSEDSKHVKKKKVDAWSKRRLIRKLLYQLRRINE